MATCASCGSAAVIDEPLRCREHFIAGFEAKVRQTIDEHRLIPHGARIAVAVSGGKDSLVVLTLLHRWFGTDGGGAVTAIAIDEGISGYRDRTLKEARRVCAENGIPLIVSSFEDLAGERLDDMIAAGGQHPCTLCGALRRRLLEEGSRGFDVIATGHNADDEAQAVLMNLIKGNTEIFPRLGPISGERPGSARRVKPLYFCTEREVLVYAYLHGLARGFEECPHVGASYRHIVRDALNSYTQHHPGAKERVLRRFLAVKAAMPPPSGTAVPCRRCNGPSSTGLCKACVVIGAVGTR